jgi:hypothetical protein
MAAKSVGEPSWWLTPNPVVAITGIKTAKGSTHKWRIVGAQTSRCISGDADYCAPPLFAVLHALHYAILGRQPEIWRMRFLRGR